MTPTDKADWPLPEHYDLQATTRLLRTGERDPTFIREPNGFWRTAHTDNGPATVHVEVTNRLVAEAWGPGARDALEQVPDWTGISEPQWSLPPHPVTDRLLHEHRGLRLTHTHDAFEATVNAVLQQLVTWNEAAMTWRRLCEAIGEPAPGPRPMTMSPTRDAIRSAGTARLQACGIGLKRARTLLVVAEYARVFKRAAKRETPDAMELMQKVRGIGPWTAATVLGMRLGRPEPIILGDFHLPNTVAFGLAGEPRADDARMVELLAPFEGQAFRVVRLLAAARITAPRRGPRRGFARHR